MAQLPEEGQMPKWMWFAKAFCLVFLAGTVARAEPVKLSIPTLPVPSLGAFLGPIINSEGFDKANGLDITFMPKPTATYRTDFAAGTDLIGGSGTLLADVALLKEKGLDVVYLFNVFDFWATVVVPKASDAKVIGDLKGKTLAASLPTTNYAMFRYLAKLGGLDVATVQLRNSDSSGLIPIAKSGRADAVQLWEPAYSILIHANDDFRSIDVMSKWQSTTGLSTIPYLGISAHQSWVDKNKALIPGLFRTYQLAGEFVQKNPKRAAAIISKAFAIPADVVEELIASGRLHLNLYWAGANKKAAAEVFKAAMDVGYLKKLPAESVLYDPAK
jgi:ABC-type nitrate/sulfonate/bicarbonate transport system substrate-binding protein